MWSRSVWVYVLGLCGRVGVCVYEARVRAYRVCRATVGTCVFERVGECWWGVRGASVGTSGFEACCGEPMHINA